MELFTCCVKNKEYRNAYMKKYRQRPNVKEKRKAYDQTPEAKQLKKEYIKNAPAYALAQINYWTKEYNKRLKKQN